MVSVALWPAQARPGAANANGRPGAAAARDEGRAGGPGQAGQSAASAMRLRFSAPITWSSAASATCSAWGGVKMWPAPGITR